MKHGAWLVLIVSLGLAGRAGAQCDASWSSDFGAPGMNGAVYALEVFDDGTGSALYAGGNFTTAGGVAALDVAKWDGSSWTALGTGMDGVVYALTVYDDGTGPALYAGGDFTMAGGSPAAHIARWDGVSWTALGGGMDDYVDALAVYDDGAGPALYAGGAFANAGGVTANRLAAWDGQSWSALPGFLSGPVFALGTYDDGTGPALYVGGFVSLFGDPSTEYVLRWDGSDWSGLMNGTSGSVLAFSVFDGGDGPELVAGGYFVYAGGYSPEQGGIEVNYIATWDGSYWSPLGTGMNAGVRALTVFDDGTGPALYASGLFTSAGGVAAQRIARWDGTTWSALGAGLGNCVGETSYCNNALASFPRGGRPALVAGGRFTSAGANPSFSIASWECSETTSVGFPVAGGLALTSRPNPFQERVRIEWRSPLEARVEAAIFDVSGRLVRRLAARGPAVGATTWDGTSDSGQRLRPGIYFLRMSNERGDQASRRLILLR